MNWGRMSRDDASLLSKKWDGMEREDLTKELNINPDTLPISPKNYRSMHFTIQALYKKSQSIESSSAKSKYHADLDFALKLYALLYRVYGMDAVTASDDDVWRYIQIKVVPSVIFDRWPGNDKDNINDERFWKNPRRIWLKTLWWYIHLSLQRDSLEETKKILLGNNADAISQLVERSGVGYRIELYRAIMKRLSLSKSNDEKLLRKVLKLNIVHCATIEPLLFHSGVEDYVDGLFRYFEDTESLNLIE